MKKRSQRAVLAMIIGTLLIPTGCGHILSKEQRQNNQLSFPSTDGRQTNRARVEQENAAKGLTAQSKHQPKVLEADTARLPLTTINGVSYVEANAFAKALEYNTDWDGDQGVLQIGEYGSNYELKVNDTTAMKEEEKVSLPQAPILRNHQVFLPSAAIQPLFGDDISFELTDREVVLRPVGEAVMDPMDGPEEADTGSELDFGDDPDDPFKGDEGEDPADAETLSGAVEELTQLSSVELEALMNQEAVPVLKNIDMNALIRRGKRYLGVKYRFGTGPYPRTGRFDCSTFTDYVFNKFGVDLPRTARAQAKRGTAVSRKNLRKGDLMFFYVPGRFRTNKTVGHVGIYMGNRRMIHASPLPRNGVQISTINKGYWKKTFLRAKRVAY
ncbi:C40 family peptidase [Paenibacillus silviterrae]|uniref:C40 family peptidase n=1 Tax=Paenibacillus silviterrae TaxID=3242194 RepID=UPI0025431E44|nr:C40 family peptidase [Paenibacillus chinjuensis]